MSENHQKILKDVLELESSSLLIAADKITPTQAEKLSKLFSSIIESGGGLGFIGVGKSGLIARKLAATFSSLGLTSYFLHPTEALHGDLGMVRKQDAIVLISKSGTTEEILKLLPFLDIPKERRIGLIGNKDSALGKECFIAFDCSVEKEACLNNQAPTTSSTLAMALGDAMAVLYEHVAGLDKESFASNHPGGFLGKSLRLKVADLMWPFDKCPILKASDTLKDAMLKMTKYPVGGCAIIDDNKNLLGILVEGDIRRYFAAGNENFEEPLKNIMNDKPTTVALSSLALDALFLMEKKEKQIDLLPVLEGRELRGFLRLHDLLKEGLSSSK